MRVRPQSDRTGVLIGRGRDTRTLFLCMCTEKRPGEDTVRRWWSLSQEESPHQKSTLLTPRAQVSSLQPCEKIDICCLIHLSLWHFVIVA